MKMTEQMCTIVLFMFGCGWSTKAGLNGGKPVLCGLLDCEEAVRQGFEMSSAQVIKSI